MEQKTRKPKAGNFLGEFRYQPRRGTRGIISKTEDRRWILRRPQRPLSMHKRALWAYIRARMGQAASRRPGGSIFIAIPPDRFFTKDRPRRRVDAEHHFEGRSIATRKLNSANGKIIWSQHSYLFPLLCEGSSGSFSLIWHPVHTALLSAKVHIWFISAAWLPLGQCCWSESMMAAAG